MPIYDYKGFDSKGKTVQGTKDADSIKALRIVLRKDGILATEVAESSGAGKPSKIKASFFGREIDFSALFQHVTVQDIASATRQLAILLQAGVQMVDSLNALIDQIDNEKLKRIYSEVRSSVNEGSSLADALERHAVFSNIYVNMVRAGESSGALEVVLERLADLLESQAQLKGKVISAMVYPSVMGLFAFLIMILMLTTVVPRISQIFIRAKIQLPLMTRILIGTSDLLSGYWWLLIIVFV